MTEHVILLHGLARSSFSMRRLARALRQAGYQVHTPNYRSMRMNIETAAETVIGEALNRCGQADKIHFVTYSLGSILLRYYLQHHPLPKLGRVVMLAPPNHGSELADFLKRFWLYRFIFGPAGMQLGTTNPASMPQRLPPADYELGIIAGTRGINPFSRPVLPAPNDGTVTVASTRLEGMKAHLALPVSHPFIISNRSVITEVLAFLHGGCFTRYTD